MARLLTFTMTGDNREQDGLAHNSSLIPDLQMNFSLEGEGKMQKGATCYLAGKMGRRKGPGIPPETDGHCQEKVRRDPVPNKPLPKGSWGKPWRTEVCLSPVLVDRLHKPHIIKTWI